MSETDNVPSGPDLAAGVPAEDVPQSGLLAGHVGGSPVLLARLDGGFFAVSGSCTHYGGPLAEGLVADGVVQCPWHHACFSLRTGAALTAPAFAALSTWQVEVIDARVFVRGEPRTHTANATTTATAAGIDRIVILGGGAAAFAAAEKLRGLGFNGTLTLLSNDADAPCDRPNLSKDYLAGTASEDWIPLQSPDFYREQRIDLRLDCEVVEIDIAARTVLTRAGERHPYDKLLIATGAAPVRMTLADLDRPNVVSLRTLADARRIIAAATRAKSVAMIGAGFISLEAAASLRARGLQVHVIAREAVPMERVLGRELGQAITRLHQEHGVEFHFQR
ncbi:MAG: FAD-dependent oxidoreductase, partial [Dokdonella sp.]